MKCNNLQLGLSVLPLTAISLATNSQSEVKYVDLYVRFGVHLRFVSGSIFFTRTTNSLMRAAYPTHITRTSISVNFSHPNIHYLNKILSVFTVLI
jgi:hypothetical protein